jgi:hypothetical protein
LKIIKKYFELQGLTYRNGIDDVMVFDCKNNNTIIYNPNDNEIIHLSDDIIFTTIYSISDLYKFLLLIKHDNISIPDDIYYEFKNQPEFLYTTETFNDTIQLISEYLLNIEDYESLQELTEYKKEYYNKMKWETI